MHGTSSRTKHRSTPRRSSLGEPAFTIIELLIVIAIIMLLMGMLMSGVNAVKQGARRTAELAAARQIMTAHINYSVAHSDAVLPGYYSDLDAFNKEGQVVTFPASARYPYRLGPFYQYSFQGLYLNEHGDRLEQIEYTDDAEYIVSLYPSLGLNSTFIGGDEDFLGTQFGAQVYGKFWVTRTSEVRKPDTLMAFASARAMDQLSDGAGVIEGYFRITPPRLTESAGMQWVEDYSQAVNPAEFGYVSPRHQDTAVAAFMDGHTGLLTRPQLKDMRHWANDADAKDWALIPR